MKDSLSSATIINNLRTRFVGQKVMYYHRLASTMDVAKREARRGVAEGTVVIADEQTASRGRMRRVWLSPQGSVSLSIVLYPDIVFLPSLIMLASLAVVYSIEAVTGLKAQIKWPNDVLVAGRKVSGILIENEVQGNTVGYTIIGIGINVNLRVSDFPDIPPTATSLSEQLGNEVSRLDIIQSLLFEVERLYLNHQVGAIYEQWRDRLVTLGESIRVKSGKAIYVGIAESVAQDGSLLLRLTDGSLTRIVGGDVTLC